MSVTAREKQLFHQKQALQAWRASVRKEPDAPENLHEDLVWELLTLCNDNLSAPSMEVDEEISSTARDLASREAANLDFGLFLVIFRDMLLRAETERVPPDGETAAHVLRFSNLITDAYWQVYADNLRKTIRQQRIDSLSSEMRLAKQVQQHLLPKMIPQIPGFQFAGRLVPAAEVGGDYWSMKHYEADGIVTMKLADITGHGVAAATLVAAVKFISGGFYRADQSPQWVMERTNHVLVKETPAEILVSMVYGWLYPATREIRIVNAGHEPVLFCGNGLCNDVRPTGPVLGAAETEYGESRYAFQPGDVLFFGSDGLVEAGITEPFGIPRLKRLIVEHSDLTADQLADLVIDAVSAYAGQPHDDLSLVVVKCVET